MKMENCQKESTPYKESGIVSCPNLWQILSFSFPLHERTKMLISYVQVRRVKHSKRLPCRCTFEIKWLNTELRWGTTTVPFKSIMRRSSEKIDSHPIFSSFISLFEETNSELDLYEIMEKASKLVDGSVENSADLLEVKSMYSLLDIFFFISLKNISFFNFNFNLNPENMGE